MTDDRKKELDEMLADLREAFHRFFKGPMFYRLEGHTPVPTDILAGCWARVRHTRVGPFRVSTIFTGIDQKRWNEGEPLLFETLTFRTSNDELIDNPENGRCHTWEEAEEKHQSAINWIMANDWQPSDTVEEFPVETDDPFWLGNLRLPVHCAACGALLKGSLTEHGPECPLSPENILKGSSPGEPPPEEPK